MITLRINNKTVNLLAGQSLGFYIKNLIFETAFLAGSRSTNFKLVVDAITQAIFGLPEKIASMTKAYSFNEFEAEILFNGIVLYKGKFILRKATNTYYEGNFMFAVADIASFKDKKIQEILGDESYVFTNENLTLQMLNTIPIANNPVVFPPVKLANKFYNTYYNDTYHLPTKVGDDGQAVPFIKMVFIFELLVKKVGYRIITPNWYATHPDVRKLIFFNNKRLRVIETIEEFEVTVESPKGDYTTINEVLFTTVTENLRYADYLPEISFGNFLIAFKNLIGIHLDFDSKRKTLAIRFFDDIFSQQEAKDITHKVSPMHEVTPFEDNKSLKFSFEKYDDDKIFSYFAEMPTDLIGYQVIEPVNTVEVLPTSSLKNTVCYVKEEYRYFVKTLYEWTEWLYPWLDYQPFGNDKKNEKVIQTAFSPVASSKKLNFLNKKGKIIKDTSDTFAKIGITIDKAQVYIKPAWIVFKESEIYKNLFKYPVDFDTIYDTRVNGYYRDDEEIAYTRLSQIGFILPESDYAMTETEFPPLKVLLYHGLQESQVPLIYNVPEDNGGIFPSSRSFGPEPEAGSRFYPMASSDRYDNFGEDINEFSLRWENQHGLVDTFWQTFVNMHEKTRRFELEAAFTLEDLRKFQPTQKVQIREAQFIIEEIETKLSAKGIDFTTLKLLRIDFSVTAKKYQMLAEGLKFNGTTHYAQILNPSYRTIRNNITFSIKLSVEREIFLPAESNTGIAGTSGLGWVLAPISSDPVTSEFFGYANWGLAVGTNGIVVYENENFHLPALAVFQSNIGIRANCVVTITSQDKFPRIYIDGVLVHTGLQSVRSAVGFWCFIGGGFYGQYLGNIYDLKVFDKVLSDTEILPLATTGIIPNSALENLQAEYKYQEKIGNIAYDTSGNGNHLTLANYTPEQLTLGPENHHVSQEGEAILS